MSDGTIISFLPFFLLRALRIEIVMKLAEEPEFTKVEYLTPNHFDHFFQTLELFLIELK